MRTILNLSIFTVISIFLGYVVVYPEYIHNANLELEEKRLENELKLLKSQKSNYSSILLLKYDKLSENYIPKEQLKIILKNSFTNSKVKHQRSYQTLFKNDYFTVSFYIKSPKEFFKWVDKLQKLDLCLALAKDIKFQKSGSRVKVSATVVISQIYK